MFAAVCKCNELHVVCQKSILVIKETLTHSFDIWHILAQDDCVCQEYSSQMSAGWRFTVRCNINVHVFFFSLAKGGGCHSISWIKSWNEQDERLGKVQFWFKK